MVARVTRRGLTAGLTLLGLAGPAAATEGHRCPDRANYLGSPLHAPPPVTAFTEAAAPFDGPLSDAESAALAAGFEDLGSKLKSSVLTAAVARPGGGLWTATKGAPPGSRFFWASTGKAFTAAVVLQLVAEGRLSLDSRLERWAPDFPNARLITINDLLTHTSGLNSFQQDRALRAQPGYKSPEILLKTALRQPSLFCPGGAWSYSNTGYVLLGRIIEAIDGRSYAEAVTARIIDRLGLRETAVVSAAGAPTDTPRPTGPQEGTSDDLRTPWAAGAIVASAADMVRFWRALLAGEVNGAATAFDQFSRLYPLFDQPGVFYGRGVMLYDLPVAPADADIWLGHSGRMPGLKAVVVFSTRRKAFVAVAFTGEGPAEAAANLLLRKLA